MCSSDLKQVVVKPDDERGMIIVEAYMDSQEPPLIVREWKFPKVKFEPSDPMNRFSMLSRQGIASGLSGAVG